MTTYNWPSVIGSLEGLIDTDLTIPIADDSYLRFDSASGKWKNETSKSITETVSNVLTISGGAKAVLDAVTIEVKAASNTIAGYLKPDEHQHILRSTHTSLESGCDLSINAGDPTKFDISSGAGIVVNNYTNIFNPTETDVTVPAATGITDLYVAISFVTYVYINSSGTVLQTPLPLDNEARRDYFIAGILVHGSGVIVDVIPYTNLISADTGQALQDLVYALGPINTGGNVYSANGVNLYLNKSVGTGLGLGQNFRNNPKDPNNVPVQADIQAGGLYSYRDGLGDWTRSTFTSPLPIDPTQWDNGSGTLQATITSKFTIQRIFVAPGVNFNITGVQYAQNSGYNSIASAQAAIASEAFVVDPLFGAALFRCYLIVKGDATDLSNPAQALFVVAPNISNVGAVGVAGDTTDLQTAYNNSVQPQITLDSGLGAFQIIDAATPLGTNLFEIKNNARTVDYFTVSSLGIKTPNVDVATAAAMSVGASVGANNLTLGGATTTAVIPGGLRVDTNLIYADSTNNRVGINRTPTAYAFEINNSFGLYNAGGSLRAISQLSSDDAFHTLYNASSAEKVKLNTNGESFFDGGVLRLGVGLKVPSTGGTASTLAHFEEGSFTPNLRALTTDFTSVTYTTRTGYFQRIGNLVTISIQINWSAYSGGSGNVYIDGLPYSSDNTGKNAFQAGTFWGDGVPFTLSSDDVVPKAYIEHSSSRIRFVSWNTLGNSNDFTTYVVSNLSSSGGIRVLLQYFV